MVKEAWITIKELALVAEPSEKTIRRTLKALEKRKPDFYATVVQKEDMKHGQFVYKLKESYWFKKFHVVEEEDMGLSEGETTQKEKLSTLPRQEEKYPEWLKTLMGETRKLGEERGRRIAMTEQLEEERKDRRKAEADALQRGDFGSYWKNRAELLEAGKEVPPVKEETDVSFEIKDTPSKVEEEAELEEEE